MTLIVDTDPLPGDKDRMLAGSDTLNSAGADLSTTLESSKNAFAVGLKTWQGGSRRDLFQHAATGIQAELLTLITAVSSANDLLQTYLNALALNNGQMDDLRDFWQGKQLELYSYPDDPAIKREVEQAGHNTQHEADVLRSRMRHLASLIAQDLDQITNLLVPGGSHMSPAAIARQVTTSLGVTFSGSTMPDAAAWKLLGIAAKAAPAETSAEDGSLDIEEFLRGLDDQAVAGTALGGEGWALTGLLRYHVSAADLARRTDALYASMVGTSLAELQAGRIAATDHVGSILRYIAAEDELATNTSAANAELLKDLRAGGGWNAPTTHLLSVLGLLGDYETLKNLDEIKNPTERTVVKYASIANALGISEGTLEVLLAANAGDEVPGWGEAVATATGVFLAGDYAYHEGPKVYDEVKDGLVDSLKGWVVAWARWH